MKSKWITLIDKNGVARHKNIIGNDEKYFLNLLREVQQINVTMLPSSRKGGWQ